MYLTLIIINNMTTTGKDIEIALTEIQQMQLQIDNHVAEEEQARLRIENLIREKKRLTR